MDGSISAAGVCVCVCVSWHLAVGVKTVLVPGAPPILEPILVVGLNRLVDVHWGV